MNAERKLTDTEYHAVSRLGYQSTVQWCASNPHEMDRDDIREAVHAEVFGPALAEYEEVEALDVSIALDEGIAEATDERLEW